MNCKSNCRDCRRCRAGLGSLDLPPIQAGAAFSLGVEVSGWNIATDWDYWTTQGLLDQIQQAIQQSGFVQIPVRVYTLNKSFVNFNPFVVVEGRANYSHSSASHLRDAILSSIQTVIGFNAGSVRFEADTYNPQTGQLNTDPSQRRYDAPSGGNNAAPPAPPNSGIDWPDSIDKLAYEFNVSQWTVVGVGALILFGGAIALKGRF